MINVESHPSLNVVRIRQNGSALLIQPDLEGNRVLFNGNGDTLFSSFISNESPTLNGSDRHPMRLMGFSKTSNTSRPELSIGIRVSSSHDAFDAARLHHTLRLMGDTPTHFVAQIDKFNDIPHVTTTILRSLGSGSTEGGQAALGVRSSLEGKCDSINSILELLDNRLITLAWVSKELEEINSLGSDGYRWDNFRGFEEAGYIPPIFLSVSSESISRSERSDRLIARLNEILTENPNRWIYLLLPSGFGAPSVSASPTSFRSLVTFMNTLLEVECDNSRIENIGLYLDYALSCPPTKMRFEVTQLAGDRLEFYLPGFETAFHVCNLKSEDVQNSLSRLRSVLANPVEGLECGTCPLFSLCPKLSTAPHLAFSNVNAHSFSGHRRDVCQIHRHSFTRVFSDLFVHLEGAGEYSHPLRLHFGQNKEITVARME